MILKNNISYLSESLLREIENCPSKEIEFKNSKDNNIVPVVDNVALHSLYYPLREGERLNLTSKKNTLFIGIGFGAGYALVDYCNKNDEAIVVVVEYNILYKILEKVDLSKNFSSKKLKLIKASEITNYFDISKYDDYFLVIHPVLQNLYSKEILNAIKTIKSLLNPMTLDIKTRKKFDFIWKKNINKNLKYLFEGGYDFSPLTIDKPIIVCGAGPSLEKNIEILKKYKDKFFIASSDSSLKVLLKNKVNPDAVFSFDCQNYSYYHFTDSNKNYRLFTDFLSPLRLKGVRQTPLFSEHPFFEIFKHLKYRTIKLSSNARNIGGATIDFFKDYFQDFPIVTVGIDYSYYKNLSYSRGTYLSEYKLINSDYFSSSEKSDAVLFYKNNFTERQGDWKSDYLLLEYKKNTKKNVYTLSDSPFVDFIKIGDISKLLEKKQSLKTLEFQKINFTPESFEESSAKI